MSKLRHVVLLGFKPKTPETTKNDLLQQFHDLQHKIAEIAHLEWGKDVSPEGLQNGHEYAFIVTFATEAHRDIYLSHPDHKALVEVIGGHLATVTAMDYWA